MKVKVYIEATIVMADPEEYKDMGLLSIEDAAEYELDKLYVSHDDGVVIDWTVTDSRVEKTSEEVAEWVEFMGEDGAA